jgi:three-Cys-motif partner protein
LDEIGYWSEVKLDIVRDYAKAYSINLSAQKKPPLYHVYIDAFAGAGIYVSRRTGAEVEGSPLIAAYTQPPFKEYHFVDLNAAKVEHLQAIFARRSDVHVHPGDCNEVLLRDVLPRVQYGHYRRGLCVLDPYGLHLNWEVIRTVGEMKSIEIFLNFPIADMNRNVFWRNPEGVAAEDVNRMNAFWGDDSRRNVAYAPMKNVLFDDMEEKAPNEVIAAAFRERLQKSAGFKAVPEPMPMRNSKGAVVYYLFFASQKPVAQDIVSHIFEKYRDRGTAKCR